MPDSQLALEKVVLTPHPLDAWRGALEALIACAPGSVFDVAWHLADVNRKLHIAPLDLEVGRTEARLINHLMLLSAGRQVGVNLEAARNGFGLLQVAPLLGEHGAHRRADRPASQEHAAPAHSALGQSSSHHAAPRPAAEAAGIPGSPAALPDTATPVQERSPELSALQSDRS